MPKPENPYKRDSLIWSIMEGDWEDLTVRQIAEVMGTDAKIVGALISRIKRETGYIVPRRKTTLGRKLDGE